MDRAVLGAIVGVVLCVLPVGADQHAAAVGEFDDDFVIVCVEDSDDR